MIGERIGRCLASRAALNFLVASRSMFQAPNTTSGPRCLVGRTTRPRKRTEWNFLNEWVTWLFKPEPKPWRPSRNPRDRYRPTNPGNAVVATDVIVDVCLLDNRQGTYCSWQQYAKRKPPSAEVVRLVDHVCTDMRLARENWHDAVPRRRQTDAYRDWDERGNRIDKVGAIACRAGHSTKRLTRQTDSHLRRGPQVKWLVRSTSTPLAGPPTAHWRTTYPFALAYLRRAERRRLDRRAHRMFQEVMRAAEMFNQSSERTTR